MVKLPHKSGKMHVGTFSVLVFLSVTLLRRYRVMSAARGYPLGHVFAMAAIPGEYSPASRCSILSIICDPTSPDEALSMDPRTGEVCSHNDRCTLHLVCIYWVALLGPGTLRF